MNRYLLTITFLVVLLASCNRNAPIFPQLSLGTYSGEFRRSGVGFESYSSQVTLDFTIDSFSGGSETHFYPAIGSGTYAVEGNKIHFVNATMWTANFDWTLILNGEYDFKKSGSGIVISRQSGGVSDQYILFKK